MQLQQNQMMMGTMGAATLGRGNPFSNDPQASGSQVHPQQQLKKEEFTMDNVFGKNNPWGQAAPAPQPQGGIQSFASNPFEGSAPAPSYPVPAPKQTTFAFDQGFSAPPTGFAAPLNAPQNASFGGFQGQSNFANFNTLQPMKTAQPPSINNTPNNPFMNASKPVQAVASSQPPVVDPFSNLVPLAAPSFTQTVPRSACTLYFYIINCTLHDL